MPSRRDLSGLGALALALTLIEPSPASMVLPETLDSLTRGSAHVFRGRCVGAEPGTTEVAGARIATTTYTFEVVDALKGPAAAARTFRQVGTAAGGRNDLGALVDLPVYRPGVEYVLFLLPASGAGLTSPVGAYQGAFVISGERVHAAGGGPLSPARLSGALVTEAATAADHTVSYDEFRRAVLEHVHR